MSKFRACVPTKTCLSTYSDYRSYKRPLQTDFFARCGYCNDHEAWSAGRRGMQIDHFVPRAKFKAVYPVDNYDNLIYSCFYCNNHKSDDWVTTDANQPIAADNLSGYIHPRDAAYDVAFERGSDGRIIPLNAISDYMFKVLCLGLRRHRLIFRLEQLWTLWLEVGNAMDDLNLSNADRKLLDKKKKELADEFLEFYKSYRDSLND